MSDKYHPTMSIWNKKMGVGLIQFRRDNYKGIDVRVNPTARGKAYETHLDYGDIQELIEVLVSELGWIHRNGERR